MFQAPQHHASKCILRWDYQCDASHMWYNYSFVWMWSIFPACFVVFGLFSPLTISEVFPTNMSPLHDVERHTVCLEWRTYVHHRLIGSTLPDAGAPGAVDGTAGDTAVVSPPKGFCWIECPLHPSCVYVVADVFKCANVQINCGIFSSTSLAAWGAIGTPGTER